MRRNCSLTRDRSPAVCAARRTVRLAAVTGVPPLPTVKATRVRSSRRARSRRSARIAYTPAAISGGAHKLSGLQRRRRPRARNLGVRLAVTPANDDLDTGTALPVPREAHGHDRRSDLLERDPDLCGDAYCAGLVRAEARQSGRVAVQLTAHGRTGLGRGGRSGRSGRGSLRSGATSRMSPATPASRSTLYEGRRISSRLRLPGARRSASSPSDGSRPACDVPRHPPGSRCRRPSIRCSVRAPRSRCA